MEGGSKTTVGKRVVRLSFGGGRSQAMNMIRRNTLPTKPSHSPEFNSDQPFSKRFRFALLPFSHFAGDGCSSLSFPAWKIC